jgi:hypothetical protein
MPHTSLPSSATRQEVVSFILRSCALLVDPRRGELKRLAERMNKHETTLSDWIKQGRVPRMSAEWLERRFGKKVANADTLCPPDHS